jgi:hypothetical protein
LDITFEQLNHYLIKGDGALFMLSGLLILINCKKLGAFTLILAVSFILATKDNPYLHSIMKSIQKEKQEKLTSILKHLSLIGAAFLLMADRGDPKVVYVNKQ